MKFNLKLAILAVIFFLIPFLFQVLFFYQGCFQILFSSQGCYEAPAETQVRPEEISFPTLSAEEFVDEYEGAGRGVVLLDLAHENNHTLAELSVLLARLAARGFRAEYLVKDVPWGAKLRYASALISIAPATNFTDEEVRLVRDFVNKGGRLLLITDPTRFNYIYDELGFPIGLKGDAPFMNSLATAFGLVFEDDYLYNMVENDSNYRNVIFRKFNSNLITEGLEKVAFYASHSISSQQARLILADENTFSSLGEKSGRGELAAAVLAEDGKVLALGDLTFLTPPHNTAYDNNRLISNIADFLTQAERHYPLEDFPYFFAEEVDLVYTGQKPLGGSVVEKGSALQAAFAQAGKKLLLRDKEDPRRDTIFVGLYTETESVEKYLKPKAITLVPQPEATETPTSKATKEAEKTSGGETGKEKTATYTPTPEVAEEATGTPAPEATEEEAKGLIKIEGVGQFEMNGNALVLLEEKGGRRAMVLLASSEEGLAVALEILNTGRLSYCLVSGEIALCPTGELPPPTPQFVETPTPAETETLSSLEEYKKSPIPTPEAP